MSEMSAAVQKATEPPVKKVETHPKVSVMVSSAITTLGDKKGSSLHAINKYIAANYNVDSRKLATRVKKYLKSAVESGELIQPTGKGASGSFKLNKIKKASEPKVPKVKPPKIPKLPTSTPRKIFKSKKNIPLNLSPVMSQPIGESEEAPADITFTAPNKKVAKKLGVALSTKTRKSKLSLPVKVKKPKKLAAKKATLPQVSSSEPGSPSSDPKPEETQNSKGKKAVPKKTSEPVSSVAKKAATKKTLATTASVAKKAATKKTLATTAPVAKEVVPKKTSAKADQK